jgi:hypothetical protein
MHNGVYIFVIVVIFVNNIRHYFIIIGHWMSFISEDHIDSIVKGICLNLKWLSQV